MNALSQKCSWANSHWESKHESQGSVGFSNSSCHSADIISQSHSAVPGQLEKDFGEKHVVLPFKNPGPYSFDASLQQWKESGLGSQCQSCCKHAVSALQDKGTLHWDLGAHKGCTPAPNEHTAEAHHPTELQSLTGMLLPPGLRGTHQNSHVPQWGTDLVK